jgi:hypothetical protein
LAGGGKFNNCKMEEIVKYDTDGNVTEVTKDDLDDRIKWETLACHAVHEAIHNMHRKGIPTVHLDEKGIYEIDSTHGKRYLKANDENGFKEDHKQDKRRNPKSHKEWTQII